MSTLLKLRDLLEEISEDAKFENFVYDSPEKFKVLIKCKVEQNESVAYYNDYAKNWINRFSAFTKTAWIVRTCYRRARLRGLAYRKTYACHRARRSKAALGRDGLCKANIDFKLNFVGQYVLKNDFHSQSGLNMNISIEYHHSHRDSDSLLTRSSDSKAVFREYLDDGYSRAAARCYHELRLAEEHRPGQQALANVNVGHQIQRIKCWRHQNVNLNDVIIRKIRTLETVGHTIRFSEAPPFVVILTPLMKRVITQIGVRRVLVDATLELGAPFTLFLYVPSFIGSLPIACVILTEHTEAIHLQIFLTIKLAIESDSNISFAPELLLHDDPKIKQALMTVFPNAIIKLNRHSLCRDIWRWISDNNLKNTNTHHDLMVLFKSLVFANSLKEANIIHDNLIMCQILGKLEEIWQDRQQWIDESGLSEGFTDAPVLLKKEFILQKCKPFNGLLPAMVDVVTKVMESQYHKILLSHQDGDVASVYTKYLAEVNLSTPSEYLRKVGPDEYLLQDAANKTRFNSLNTDTLCCDCGDGQRARMCKHLCGVLATLDSKFVLCSSLNIDERKTFIKILQDDTYVIKYENEHDLLEIEETAIDDEMSMSSSSKAGDANCDVEIIKKEDEDPLEQNHDGDTRVIFASKDTSKDFKEQYEASMKAVNDEFRRLNKLFRENPNRTNLCTMQRLATELAKIVVVQEVDLSNMFVALNSKAGES